MKNLIIILSVFVIEACLLSCKKSGQNPNTNTQTGTSNTAFNGPIGGKWSIKNDSLVAGVGSTVNVTNYIGTTGDYFDFRADNKAYIKEGAKLDTFTFQLLSDSTIRISKFAIAFGDTLTSQIRLSNSNNMTLLSYGPPLPGGYYFRVVNLVK